MCEFCVSPTKSLKLHRQETDSNIVECYIHGASDGYALFLRQDLRVWIDDDRNPRIQQGNEYVYLDINYCPICGRDLRSECNAEDR